MTPRLLSGKVKRTDALRTTWILAANFHLQNGVPPVGEGFPSSSSQNIRTVGN